MTGLMKKGRCEVYGKHEGLNYQCLRIKFKDYSVKDFLVFKNKTSEVRKIN